MERDCQNCIRSKGVTEYDNGCTSWDCDYINRAEAIKIYEAYKNIVRCGECKHWYSDADCGMACEFTNLGQPSNGFCNWGERRNDDSNT